MKLKINILILACMFFIGYSNVVSQNKPQSLNQFTGKYEGNRVVAIENGKLFIQRNGGRKIVLEQRSKNTFESTSGMFPPLKFKKNDKDEVIGFVMLRNGNESDLRAKIKEDKLQEYAGVYEGNRVVGVENGKLFIQRSAVRKIFLKEAANGIFKSTSTTFRFPDLKFKRDNKGKIIGFTMIRNGKEGELRKKISNSVNTVKEKTITAQDKKELIDGLSKKLLENYVFPEVAVKYSSLLKNNLKSGKYDKITGEQTFAATITKDLNNFKEDKHLFVMTNESYESQMKQMKKATADMNALKKGKGKSEDTFMHSKILDGNIGHVTITSFPDSKEAEEHAHSVMKSVKDCKAIVFDVRRNRGGALRVIEVIDSYLYKKRTHTLSSLVPRENNGKASKRFTKPNRFSRKMSKIPVYVLSSKGTASAGEDFTMGFKSTGRGLVVGENTYGAGHYSEYLSVSKKFHALMPFSKTFNPKTGEGWEGVGVTPDVKIAPSKSLDWVLKKIN